MGRTAASRAAGTLRLLALFGGLAALLVFARPTPAGVTAGFVVVLCGETIRLWAAGYLHKNRVLATGGPYRYTRNPLYLGRLLIFTGICVMARLPHGASWIVLALGWVVFFAYYLPRKERVEPARLREWHGAAYEEYHRAVPALFPTRRPYLRDSGQGWSSDRMLRNREHWMLAGLVAVTLLLYWKAYLPS